MSSTSNAQDLLVNVFRPTYHWDSNTGFVPSLVVSNVTEVITDKVNAGSLVINDAKQNTYIGFNAGPNLGVTSTASNVAIGVSAMSSATNSSNNVSIGASNFSALANANNNVGIGANTVMTGRGEKNILLGANNTLGDGSGNIIIGNDLALGNLSKTLRLGSLIYGDLNRGFLGVNTPSPEAALDISGEVLFRNKVGIQKNSPVYTLDVAGSIFASEQIIGGKGTQSAPMYTFFDSSGSGMYVPTDASYGTGAFGIAVNRKRAAIFSDTAVNFFQNLDVSGTFSARNIDISAFSVTNGTASKPSVTFTSDTSTGLYLVSANRLGVTTGGVRRMEVLSNGDVSAGQFVARDISYSGRILGTDATTCNIIGGVTLQNGFVITTGTTTSTNLVVPGYIRDNSVTPLLLDISLGNISNSLTTRSSNFRALNGTVTAPAYSFVNDPSSGMQLTNVSTLGFDTTGVQRMCISGGFVGIGRAAPVVALDVLGDVSATTYNGPGGTAAAPHFTSSDDRTTGVFFPAAGVVGFTTGGAERMRVSNGNVGIGRTAPVVALDVLGDVSATTYNGPGGTAAAPHFTSSDDRTTGVFFPGANIVGVTAGGAERMRISNGNVGIGTKTPANALDVSGTLRVLGPAGDITFTNGAISIGGSNVISSTGVLSNGTATSNSIGGVTLTNNQVSNSSYTTSSQFIASVDGAAGGPAFTFASEAGLGLYKSAAGTLALATGTSNRMTVDSYGAVTVNASTSPDYYTLKVAGDVSAGAVVSASNIARLYGTATLPSFAFTNGPSNWGLFAPASNQLAIATNGSNRMFFDSTGSIGIGTTAPGTTLVDVAKAGTGVTADLRIRAGELGTASSANKAILRLSFKGSDGGEKENGFQTDYVGGNTGISVYYIDTGNTVPYVRFDGTAQRVGIGKMAPAQTLDVSGDANVQSAGTGGTLYVGGTSGVFMNCDTTANKNGFIRAGSSTANLYLGTSNNNRMMIASSGNIGIGTLNPGATLDVSGGVIRVQRVFNANVNGLVFADGTGTLTTRWGLGMFNAATGSGSGGNDFVINSYDDSLAITQPFTIKRSNGNVGIGTTTPGYTLDVCGTIGAHSNEYSVYLTSGTSLTVPTGFTKAHVTLVGGGGAGGGTAYSGSGGGGGAAGYIVTQLLTSLGASLTYALGSGGAGASGLVGGTGGDSTLTSGSYTMRATGGGGGGAGFYNGTSAQGGTGGSGYFGGGGGGSFTPGTGGTGVIQSGNVAGSSGGRGGGSYLNGGTGSGSGGGGGGPLGGTGATSATGDVGGAGCGGGGGGTTLNSTGGAGGAGYAIIKFLR